MPASNFTKEMMDAMLKEMRDKPSLVDLYKPQPEVLRKPMSTFMGLPVHTSRHCQERKEKRKVVVEEFEWRGRKDWRTRIITEVEIKPLAYVVSNTMTNSNQESIIAHPDIIRSIREAFRSYADRETTRILKGLT